jgi:hypothetical protein
MADYDKKWEHKADYGSLKANPSKSSQGLPDYWGEIAIDPRDLTAIKEENGLLIYKLSGWKKQYKMGPQAGQTYLSISVNRWIPDAEKAAPRKASTTDEDVPF